MIDVERLEQAVKDFVYYSRPSSSNGSSPTTVDDFNELVRQTAKVLNQFIEELGKQR